MLTAAYSTPATAGCLCPTWATMASTSMAGMVHASHTRPSLHCPLAMAHVTLFSTQRTRSPFLAVSLEAVCRCDAMHLQQPPVDLSVCLSAD